MKEYTVKLVLSHEHRDPHSTAGRMTSEEGWSCYTMEIGDPLRQGTYEVVMAHSARMNQSLPAFRTPDGRIVGFVHPGTPERLHPAHLMLGLTRAVDLVVDSRKAYKQLMDMLDDNNSFFQEMVTLEVNPLQESTANEYDHTSLRPV